MLRDIDAERRPERKTTESDVLSLADAMRRSNPAARVEIPVTIDQAFSLSHTLATSLKRRIYVAGGLFTAIEFAAVARGLDPKQLSFF